MKFYYLESKYAPERTTEGELRRVTQKYHGEQETWRDLTPAPGPRRAKTWPPGCERPELERGPYLVPGCVPVVILPVGQRSLFYLLIPALCSHLQPSTTSINPPASKTRFM